MKCADLPIPLYDTYVAVVGSDVYVTGSSAYRDITCQVFHYNLITDQWDRLPEPGHRLGILCVVGNHLTIFGGRDAITDERHNKVSTYSKDTNTWSAYYPNMIHMRSKPGVVTHGDHVIVMGGAGKGDIRHDNIEIMNYRQRSPWREVCIHLPREMSSMRPTIAGENLLIVGYTDNEGRDKRFYQLPAASITSLSSSDHVANQWEQLSSAPHFNTVTVPYSNPPLIIGGVGHDSQGSVPTSDISLYDSSKKSWIPVDSLTTARHHVGVATINSYTIIVVGGTNSGAGIEGALSSSLPIVEIGNIVHN